MANADDEQPHPEDFEDASAEESAEGCCRARTASSGGHAETVTIAAEELESIQSELEEFKDKYLRVLAESENARKRLIKEKQEMIQYNLQNLICDFLVPIDQMENALKHSDKMSDEVKQWSIGFQMILTHFKDVLSNNNVKPFDSVGKAFDPHHHEAIEMVHTTEYPEGTVVEENLRGYMMGEKVIRPARVKVAKAPKNEEGKDEVATNAKNGD